MKKFIPMVLALALLLGASSCTSCTKEKQKKQFTVEQTIADDHAYMADNHTDFVWYESQITLKDWLDRGTTSNVMCVDNVFQYFRDGQPHVIIFSHYNSGKCDTSRHDDIWIEDCAMSSTDIAISYRQAYEQMMKSNYPKPHSRQCTLREEVGPYPSNPQYIFGNLDSQLYVDAKTGRVSNASPAFNPRE